MSEPGDLAAFLAEAWQHLARGVADARSPARFPVLATVSPDGIPQARTVALRAARQSLAHIEVHTDIASTKIEALRAHPVAALHVWLPKANLQIRLTCGMQILSGEQVDEHWRRVPPRSRVSYGTVPPPGTPIPDVFAYEKPPDRARFAVLRGQVTVIDLVHLGPSHRRADFRASDGWRGQWLAP